MTTENAEQQQQQQRRNQGSSCVSNSLHILPTVNHRPQKLVIAHRGASYHLPEHTLPAYRLALELGADFIEPDIVATSDGKLIAIHSVDLNITTNVAQVFADREPWFSPYAGRRGYWSFNFTYDEIAQLRVKQRLPDMRTNRFDNLFPVPLLDDVLSELIDWNQNELPQTILHTTEQATTNPIVPPPDAEEVILRKPSPLELAESGLYLELKEWEWLKEEAELDLVELLFQHFDENSFEWDWIMPCFQQLDYDTYKVPGLVIEAFDVHALSAFHKKWEATRDATEVAEPPYVLLADMERCQSEKFWNEVGKSLQSFISGIGPDKRCLIPKTPVDEEAEEGNKNSTSLTLSRARHYNLALHPWTERPEKSFLAYSRYESVLEETRHLFCDVGVEGIFSESVSFARQVAEAGCQSATEHGDTTQSEGRLEPPFCYDNRREMSIYVGLSMFLVGCFVASLFCLLCARRQRPDPEMEPMVAAASSALMSPSMEAAAAGRQGSAKSKKKAAPKSAKAQKAPPPKVHEVV